MNWHVQLEQDSFTFLKAMADRSVDHIITDPPYDSHCQANQMSGTTLEKVGLPFAPLESRAFTRDLVHAARRWAICFCTVEDLGLFREAVGGPRNTGGAWVRGGIWYKPNSMGQLTGDRPAAAYEGIGIMHRKDGKMRWNGRGSYGIWKCNGTRGEKDRHPSQKPLKLLCDLIAGR